MKISRHQEVRGGKPARKSRKSGYVLLAILFMLTLAIIAFDRRSFPRWSPQSSAEREIELQHRGNQYVRALQLYFRKFGRYPQLHRPTGRTPNNLRFLRKRYKDPITGTGRMESSSDWGRRIPSSVPAYLAGATPASKMAGATPAANLGGAAAGSSSNSGGF